MISLITPEIVEGRLNVRVKVAARLLPGSSCNLYPYSYWFPEPEAMVILLVVLSARTLNATPLADRQNR